MIQDKINGRFRGLEGGLFSSVTKADVGEGAGRLIEEGYDVMGWADPFFPDPSLPDSVARAMSDSIASGLSSHYTMPIGSLSLRRAVAEKCARINGLRLDPSRNILITPGSDSGLLFAMQPFLTEGDEVLVPDPSYPSNFLNCRLCGAAPVPVPLPEDKGFQFDMDAFEQQVTARTKMIVVTHPNNPTGTVFDRSSWEAMRRFILKHDLILICDQAFEDHIFDGRERITPAALDGLWERTVTVFSTSKGLGLSGLRVGYLAADDHLMDIYYGAAVNVLGATNTAAQIGAEAAMRDPSILTRYTRILERRRRLAYNIFSEVPGISMRMPESGILSWLNVGALGTGEQVADYLLDNARVLVNAGGNYGEQGKNHIRIVHGCYADEAHAAVVYRRIADALTKMGRCG